MRTRTTSTRTARRGVGWLLVLAGLGCDSSQPDKAVSDQKVRDAPDPPPDDRREATFADPKIEPPRAPPGSITIPDPWLYVQTCAESHPCSELLQPAGDAACRALELGGRHDWRLPSKDEVARFSGVDGLEQTAGYHWTRTPFEADLGQVWIVDPSGDGPPTTVARDRKSFRVRCVTEP